MAHYIPLRALITRLGHPPRPMKHTMHSIAQQTHCYMVTTSQARRRSTASLAKSTESAYHWLRTQDFPLTLFISIEKKQKFHRKRINEDEGDITYINEQNRVFNKKVRDQLLHFIILLRLPVPTCLSYHMRTFQWNLC